MAEAVPAGVRIEPFDPRAASDEDFRPLFDFEVALRAESEPDDPPLHLETWLAGMRSIPPVVDLRAWVARDPAGQAVGEANVALARLEENRHVAQFELKVRPEARRRGLGRALLGRLLEAAETDGRSLLITATSSRVPAGEAAMARLGAERALETHTNQLDLADLDRGLVQRWESEGPRHAPGYRLQLLDGPTPEGLLEPVAELLNVMNSAPRGDLQVEDTRFTPELLRQFEANALAGGRRRLALLAVAPNGALAGLTDLGWRPQRASLVSQGNTGVLAEHRGRGLGKWLKAAMLEALLERNPEARFVRTGNADSNAPMLAINRALGFTPHSALTVWQVPTERVRAYLEGPASGPVKG